MVGVYVIFFVKIIILGSIFRAWLIRESANTRLYMVITRLFIPGLGHSLGKALTHVTQKYLENRSLTKYL